jgi:HTH-type transcriptional regulator/antitoxin HigA
MSIADILAPGLRWDALGLATPIRARGTMPSCLPLWMKPSSALGVTMPRSSGWYRLWLTGSASMRRGCIRGPSFRHELLRALMVEHDIKQSELPEVGPQPVVSDVLAGKRALNLRQVAALAARFHVPMEVFTV